MDNGTASDTTPGSPGSAAGTVPLHRLTFVDEGHDVLIGRPEIESFALFPPDGAELVRRFQAGDTVGQAADWYRAEYGEDADLDDVVAALHSLGFVRTPEDAGGPPGDEGEPSGAAGLPAVRWRRLSAVLFSPPLLAGYALLTVVAVYLEIRRPTLRPAPGNFFAGRSLLLLELVVYLGEALGVLWHEGFHALAGRRLGLGSRLTIGRRLTFIVFQTTMTGLMGVPPRKRILPFCAGLLADAINYSLMVVIAAVDIHLHGHLTTLGHFALLLAFVTMLRISFQFMIFTETDLYYVFATITHTPNLLRLTHQELRRRLHRKPGPGPHLDPTAHEQRIMRFYLPFVAVGAGLVFGATAVFAIPVAVQFMVRLGTGIADGGSFGARFWDSAAAAVAVAAQCGILLVLVLRERRAARSAALAAAVAASRTHPPIGADPT